MQTIYCTFDCFLKMVIFTLWILYHDLRGRSILKIWMFGLGSEGRRFYTLTNKDPPSTLRYICSINLWCSVLTTREYHVNEVSLECQLRYCHLTKVLKRSSWAVEQSQNFSHLWLARNEAAFFTSYRLRRNRRRNFNDQFRHK